MFLQTFNLFVESAMQINTTNLSELITREESELLEREGRIERAQRNAYYEIGL